jgi:CRISPR/Cas system CSM-associated protein Csm5 (group 7 of RAMP superfamily)
LKQDIHKGFYVDGSTINGACRGEYYQGFLHRLHRAINKDQGEITKKEKYIGLY